MHASLHAAALAVEIRVRLLHMERLQEWLQSQSLWLRSGNLMRLP